MNTLKHALSQKTIPVIAYRRKEGLRVRLPYSDTNFDWLRNGRHRRPHWHPIKRCWVLPKAWFQDTVQRAVEFYGSAYVLQQTRQRQTCAPKCQNAEGIDCECSCLGENHGIEAEGRWHIVSDTCAVQWGPLEMSLRLLKRAPA